MNKYLRYYLLINWVFFILIVTGFPTSSYNGTMIGWHDKIFHMLLFGVLAYLIFYSLMSHKVVSKTAAIIAVFFSVFMSAGVELMQNYVPGRTVSEYDFLAGLIGNIIFLGAIKIKFKNKKPRLLLHICCATCGVYIAGLLEKEYRVTLFYYNPNIYPESEYLDRYNETKKIAKKYKIKLITGEYNHKKWLDKIKGHEHDKERGKRCIICYRERLEEVAKLARKKKFKYFTTTLTVSPHKLAQEIFKIGKKLEKDYNIIFLEKDFKKNNGFKKSSEISKKLGLYQQNYCGCEFSKK